MVKRLILLTCLFYCMEQATGQSNLALTTTQWLEDLDFLKEKIETKHLSPYHFISKEEFEEAYQKARNQLQEANGAAAALTLASFAAKIGDGHTYVSPFEEFNRFPVRISWFQDRLHIIDIDSTWIHLLGAEVLQFKNKNSLEALTLSSQLSALHETPNHLKSDSEYFLTLSEVLQYLALSDNEGRMILTVRKKDGEQEKVTIPVKSEKETRWVGSFLYTPLRYAGGKPLWYYHIPNTQVGYFNFWWYPSKKDVKAFAKELNDWLANQDINTFLVDFRNNMGGDYTKGQTILKTIQQTVEDKKLKVFIAIGKYTFSAGMSNASHFHEGLKGTYIGQISGARPNGYQENNNFNLPNSGLRASYSSRYYTFSTENTDGLIPEIPIRYDWETYRNGLDPLVDYVIKSSRQ